MVKSFSLGIVAVCCALALAACKKQPRATGLVADAASGAAADAGFAAVPGMPATDRAWSAADMARAAEALTGLSADDPARLPRFGSPIFARVASTENLAVFRDASVPVGTRIKDATDYLESANAINKLYLAAFTRGAVSPREPAAMMAAILHVVVAVAQVADAFMASQPADDPKREARLQGVAQMKRGYASVVMGALLVLAERASFPAADRLLLARELRQTLPAFREPLRDKMAELATRFSALARDESVPELRAVLTELASLAARP